MTRYLLDTNIISNATKPEPSESLIAWLSEQADEDLFIASLTVAEVWFGILACPVGKKRAPLESWFASPDGPQSLFAGRILPFDEKAALIWARLMAEGERAGFSLIHADDLVNLLILAAVAEANGCIVVTDNEKDFIGLKHINPMRTGS